MTNQAIRNRKSNRNLTVLKLGGAFLDELQRSDALGSFWEHVKSLQKDRTVVIVHGGGDQSTRLAHQLGHSPRVVQGRRITSNLDLQILQWAVRGEVSTGLVASASKSAVSAVGLSGADAEMVQVSKRPIWNIGGEEIEFGHVGDVEFVQSRLLKVLINTGFVPIVAPLGIDSFGNIYNVNADTVALEVSCALGASELVFLTISGGVLKDTLLTECDSSLSREGIEAGWINAGMRVKVDVGFAALERGVERVRIAGMDTVSDPAGGTLLVDSHCNIPVNA